MKDFYPREIYVHPEVKNLPVTTRILNKFSDLPIYEISHRQEIKFPQDHTRAKKQLFIDKFQGQALKTCQGMGDYVCCQYHTIALVTDCHLECTYCILQDYLKNNPVITIYANIQDIFDEIRQKVAKHPDKTLRIGTGELSDSLALDHITEFSKDLITFANEHDNIVLELKTKTSNIHNLLDLKHNGNVVVSWSINPQSYIEKEEIKCDSLDARLQAAKKCVEKGYPVGFHLDPLLFFDDWKEGYTQLIDEVASRFEPKDMAWVSVGSLRFTPGLKKITQERFPKSKIMSAEMFPSQDGKIRYFRPLREEMYRHVTNEIRTKLQKVPFYLCMETKAVWKNVFGEIPKNNSELEQYLSAKF